MTIGLDLKDAAERKFGTVRKFDTGATRSGDTGRYDPEGFLSPIVIERYSEYLNKHRNQPDGSVRDSDNWQKGIPLAVYAKGLWRHFLHFWTRHRGYVVQDDKASADIEEDLCAIIFGAQGYLFELLKDRRRVRDEIEGQTFGPLPDTDEVLHSTKVAWKEIEAAMGPLYGSSVTERADLKGHQQGVNAFFRASLAAGAGNRLEEGWLPWYVVRGAVPGSKRDEDRG